MRTFLLVVLAASSGVLSSNLALAGTDFGRVAPIDPTAAMTDGTAFDLNSEIGTDGDGVWIATWSAFPGGTLGISGLGAPVISRSLDDGVTWSPAALVRPDTSDDSGATSTVATDASGKWMLVWGRTRYELQVAESTDDGQTWGSPTVLFSAASLGNNSGATIETDRSGTWLVAWAAEDSLGGTIGEDGDLLFVRSTDDGASWSAAAPLNITAASDSPGDRDGPVRVATDRAGTWVAVWSTFAQAWWARSTDNGATWSVPVALGHVGLDGTSYPDVATDSSGRWIAVWSTSNDAMGGYGEEDIWFSISSDNGATWSIESKLHPYMDADTADDGLDSQPRVESLGSGLWTVVWYGGVHRTTGDDLDISISSSRDNGVSWSAPAVLTGRASLDNDALDFAAAYAVSPTGKSVVVWTSEDSLGDTIGTDTDILVASANRDCPSQARGDCRLPTAGGSFLKISDVDGGRDRLKWRWRSPDASTDADLGDPTLTDAYVLCLYEKVGGVSGLIGEWDMQAGGTCKGLPCWTKDTGKISYADRSLEGGSIKTLSATAGNHGTRIKLQGIGPALAPPRLPLDSGTPVRVQLVNRGTGVCWDGTYNQPKLNDAKRFVSTSN